VVRIALGQLNLTVGDLDGNVGYLTEASRRATEGGADLVAFPELAITGYPPEDLVLRAGFVDDGLRALDALAAATSSGCAVLVGFVDRSERGLHNSAALLRGGRVETRYAKRQLPNYGVFDERRYFVPGEVTERLTIGEVAWGPSVCEDAWQPGPPFSDWTAPGSRVGLIVNVNASPYHRGKTAEREDILRARALETGAWIAYVNLVGGQDELVFDGGSMVVAPDGTVAVRALRFEEDLLFVDIDLDAGTIGAPTRPQWPDDVAEVYRALVLGLRDYAGKNGFADAVLGLSGGIDSALVAVLAADALGPDHVRGLTMPSSYSSAGSVDDSMELARRVGLRLDTLAIGEVMSAYERALAPVFDEGSPGVAEENLQARIRGNLLMALSNRFGSIVLATGNKSEYAVGYSTLYGDMAGGFAPIKDVPKTLVYELCAWRNAQAAGAGTVPPIPEPIMTKPPSAELRPGQRDTDSLPSYDVLDPIVEGYVEDDLGIEDLVAAGHDRATVERVVRLIDRAEYKRRQAAPGIKITPKAFGRDRRMPITNRYDPDRT
jgi:NAD+ synthase (glutamine-hydrolysing)